MVKLTKAAEELVNESISDECNGEAEKAAEDLVNAMQRLTNAMRRPVKAMRQPQKQWKAPTNAVEKTIKKQHEISLTSIMLYARIIKCVII